MSNEKQLTEDTVIAAFGTSCRHKIEHLTSAHPKHVAELLAESEAPPQRRELMSRDRVWNVGRFQLGDLCGRQRQCERRDRVIEVTWLRCADDRSNDAWLV